jgi:hypothetical protein
MGCHGTDAFSMAMAQLCLRADINLLGTEYRLHCDREGCLKSDKWVVEWLTEMLPTWVV